MKERSILPMSCGAWALLLPIDHRPRRVNATFMHARDCF